VPTYQYVCTNPETKHEFEVVQSFSDPSLTECPQCGSPVRKVYGSVGVVFKGSGFYRTDSRAGAGKSDGGSKSGDSSGGGSKESSSPSSGSGSSSGTSSSSSGSSSSGSQSSGAPSSSSSSKAAG
jgi:putative FmdB family regulatory protein